MRTVPCLACSAALVLAVCAPMRLHAQLYEMTHGHYPGMRLSSQEETTIDRLDSLDVLPAGTWRYHAGDVPHGEDPSLDDSGWEQVTPKGSRHEFFKAPKEAVWFRREIEVPQTLNGYDLTGAQVWFRFRAQANGPVPEIIYFNGRRVALGEDLEPIILFGNAKPGDKMLVAVKLLPSVDEKTIAGVDLRLEFATSRPNPADLRTEFLTAALLIPTLSKDVPGDQATLAKAIGDVNLQALDGKDQDKFDASLKQAQEELKPLKPMLQQADQHLTGNSHIDAAWLWPWTETVDVVKRTFGTAAQLMNEYPAYTYTQSAAQYSQWIADKYPEMNDEINRRIHEGRWEIVGGMWVEPDLNMPSGESLVRQILVGQETFHKLYGVSARIGWNPDSFGYNWQLPQIYKRSGIDYFVTQKMTWNDTNQLPLKLFWWESPDGSRVLTYFPHDYGNPNLDPVRLAQNTVEARDRAPGILEVMDLYGVGDHGGGPTRAMLDQGIHWMQPDKVVPRSEFSIAQTYFNAVETKLNPDSPTWNYGTLAKGDTKLPVPGSDQISIPTWKDELYLEYHRGVFTTQADHKRNMRESEEWVLNAEKYASLAWLDGQSYPQAELTDAWKHVLFNQFHDLAAGSGIGDIYRDAQKDYNQVRWATNEITAKSLDAIQARVDTRVPVGSVPLLVMNPLGWDRSGVVEATVEMPEATPNGISILDGKGRAVPFSITKSDGKTATYQVAFLASDVPSMGYEVMRAVPGKRIVTSDVKTDGLTIENAILRMTVDSRSGCITSLYDKQAGFETLAKGGCGNELQAFKDTPKEYDAWNIDPGTLDVPPAKLDTADSVTLAEHNPLRATIRVVHTWQSSKFVQDITLYAGLDHVVVSNDFDWRERHILLKAAFPLAAAGPAATYEIPYGTIERPTTRNNSFEKAKFEVPALRFADLGGSKQGMSLINDHKYGYDAVDNVLRLSLLRAPTWPDPDADQGRQRFSYALYPHAGDWKQAFSVRHGWDFDYKLKAVQVQPHTGSLPARHSFAAVSDPNVVLTAMKRSEDGSGLVLRFYEWAGKGGNVTLTVPAGASTATVTNLMEKPEGSPLSITGDKVTVPVTPYEIQTVKVDYSPTPSE